MKLLLIEDDPGIQEAVTLSFELHWPSAEVMTADHGSQGVILTETDTPDIIILDLGLPDKDGFEVLKEIRDFSDIPIIILTVRGEEIDKVRGLELGADDYVVKPFSHMELLARVRAVIRRCRRTPHQKKAEPILSAGLSIDFASRSVTKDGNLIKLTPTEFRLLYYLTRNPGKVLTHHALLARVWGEEYTDSPEYLKVYIQRLREKVEETPSAPKLLLSERGVGYKFVQPPA